MSNLPNIIGRKAICVHPHFDAAVFNCFDRIPEPGVVYTVKEIFWAKQHGTGETVVSIRLDELPPIEPGVGGLSLWRFRLLNNLRPLRKRHRRNHLLHSPTHPFPGISTPNP